MIRKAVAAWFEEHPGYEDCKPVALAPLIVADLPTRILILAGQRMVRQCIGEIARSEGKNAVRNEDGDVIYVEPATLPLEPFLLEYLIPQRRRTSALQRRTRAVCKDWCRRHPEASLTARDLWHMASEAERAEVAA